jgi:hypothetical protein
MPRIRTIHPNFPHGRAVTRLSRDARLLFILLWTRADDSGRLRLDAERLVEDLFPSDDDAALLLPSWLDELERQQCIERYEVEGAAFLRVVGWRRIQKVNHPSRSRLPAAPLESLEILEESPKTSAGQASKADPLETPIFSEEEIARLGQDEAFDKSLVRGYLRYALQKSLDENVHTSAARYIELMGREAGLWGGRGTSAGEHEPEKPVFPSLDDLFTPEERGEVPKVDGT